MKKAIKIIISGFVGSLLFVYPAFADDFEISGYIKKYMLIIPVISASSLWHQKKVWFSIKDGGYAIVCPARIC